MSLILRTSNTPNVGTDYIKGTPLTYPELDGNFAAISQSFLQRPLIYPGPGIIINTAGNASYISSSVISVNGQLPVNGNIAVTFTSVITGPLFSRPAIAADATICIWPSDVEEKDINEIQIDPTAYDEVFKKYGHELVNARGFLNLVNKMPKTIDKKQTGRTTIETAIYPWQKAVNGVPTMDTEQTQMTDENGNPINVNVIKDNTYKLIIDYAPEMNDFLNAQLNLVSSELGREVDPDSQEGILYKKKLMTELLEETGGAKKFQTTKIWKPSTGGGGKGSASEQEKAQKSEIGRYN